MGISLMGMVPMHKGMVSMHYRYPYPWIWILCGYGLGSAPRHPWVYPRRTLSMRFPQVFGLSGRCLTALLGEFGHFDPIWCILMVPASSVGVIECMHMFSVPGWWLDPSVSFAQPFALMVGGFGGFDSIRCVLTVSGVIVGVNVFVSTLGMSIDQVDVSTWLPTPSVSLTPCFVSPGPRYVPAPSPWLILAISGLFGALSTSAHPLKSSARPLDLSMWPSEASALLLGWCMSFACQRTCSRCTCGISPLRGFSNLMDTVTSVSGSFGVLLSFWGMDCPLELCVQLIAAPPTLSPLSSRLCCLGKWILGFGCPFECCTLAFMHPIGWGMYRVDLCWCFTVFLGWFHEDGIGPLPVIIPDVLSAILGAGKAIPSFWFPSCTVHCCCPLLSAVSWSSPLDVPSGTFGRSPGSLG